LEIPGDAAFPALVLPADKVAFSSARAYPVSFETDGEHLFAQIASFELQEGPGRVGDPGGVQAEG
jgi:hypothetical protein